MNAKHNNRLTAGILLTGCSFLAMSAQAGDCKKVHAEMTEVQVLENCASPNNFCAEGTIDGNQGLQGTTFFTLDGAVLGPASSPGTVAYSGIFEITTDRGSLLLREAGITRKRPGHPAGGIFSSTAEVQSGTGIYTGASGDFYFNGRNVDGLFLVEVTGHLCQS